MRLKRGHRDGIKPKARPYRSTINLVFLGVRSGAQRDRIGIALLRERLPSLDLPCYSIFDMVTFFRR
jgi:hypothetical protein